MRSFLRVLAMWLALVTPSWAAGTIPLAMSQHRVSQHSRERARAREIRERMRVSGVTVIGGWLKPAMLSEQQSRRIGLCRKQPICAQFWRRTIEITAEFARVFAAPIIVN
jgi:hypothetical protein